MRKRWMQLLIAFALVLALTIPFAVPAYAATNQDVTVTATPAFIAISNSPTTWTINGITGSGVIAEDTIYYTNPLGDTTSPSSTVVDGECRFTITNTSTVAIDLTVNFPDHTGGDASTNSNLGTNDTTKFGAYSYFSGDLFSAKVIAQSSGSAVAYDGLAASTDIKWGLMYESQSNTWTSGSAMSSTVNIAATAD